MTQSLFSPSWYRVAQLRLRLPPHVRFHRHHYRGELWYVLQDPVSGRQHRFSPAGYYLLQLLDGQRSIQELWELANAQLGDEAPTQDEMIQLLGQLHGADLLCGNVPPDTREVLLRQQHQHRLRWRQRLGNPLALRFPLLNPEPLLARGLPLARSLFSPLGGLVWLLTVITAALLAAAHWPELSSDLADRVLAPDNLLLLWLLYPSVKILHELGHGFATKVWGGEVHELGITLLAMLPVPYIDASAASALPDKHQRLVVGAAGMMVELFLASLALFVWLSVEPGLIREIAYNVMLIGGVSTLLVNANPLLRFDGYYIFADAIEIPNLAGHARRYLAYLVLHYLFAVEDTPCPATTRGERSWFVAYGIASFSYRLIIATVAILFVAGKFLVIGVLLAVWAAIALFLLPLLKQLGFLLTSPVLRRQRLRAVAATGFLLATVGALLAFLPVPLWSNAEGVVWLPEQAEVRAGTEGLIRRFLAEPGTRVQRGDPLAELEDPLLPAEIRVLEARVAELNARYIALWRSDRVQTEIIKNDLSVATADLARARERARELIICSPSDGVFIVPQADDLPGRLLHQGDLLAYVADRSAITVRAVVSQADIGLVRGRTQSVWVKLAEGMAKTFPAFIQREVPAATDRLPSAALSTIGGGRIAFETDDPEGLRTRDPVFQLDLQLPEQIPVAGLGGRVYVRFEHGREALMWQWYRRLRQLLLRRFNV
jgi:putative peptide zinc metalloprotease protein